jgi:nucleotide-binding universal stress UspA family protein
MPTNTIVVGVDESPQARAALAWAADMARLTGSTLVGVHVLAWPQAGDLYAYSVVADQVYPDPDQLEELYRAPSEHVFAAVDPEPGWTLRFAQGHVGHVLVDQSRDARMLVLGAREHTGVMRLLNGSAGHYCLNHVVCPLVAVPAGSRHAAGTSSSSSSSSAVPSSADATGAGDRPPVHHVR